MWWLESGWDGSGWLEMARDGSGWLEMARDGSGWLGMARDGSGWLGMARDGSGWLGMLGMARDARDGSGWLGMARGGEPRPSLCVRRRSPTRWRHRPHTSPCAAPPLITPESAPTHPPVPSHLSACLPACAQAKMVIVGGRTQREGAHRGRAQQREGARDYSKKCG